MPTLYDRLGLLLCGLSGCTGAAASAPPRAAEVVPPLATPATPAPSAHRPCSTLVLEDWEDGDSRATSSQGPSGAWHSYTDTSGSTLAPNGAFLPARGGAHGSQYAGHIQGKLGSAQHVWAGLAERFGAPATPQDLSQWRRVCFQAKGSGRARLDMPDANTDPEGGVCKQCYNYFGANFNLSADWQEQCFELDSLTQTCCYGEARPALAVEKVLGLSWSAHTPGADYDLWVDDIQLRCD